MNSSDTPDEVAICDSGPPILLQVLTGDPPSDNPNRGNSALVEVCSDTFDE